MELSAIRGWGTCRPCICRCMISLTKRSRKHRSSQFPRRVGGCCCCCSLKTKPQSKADAILIRLIPENVIREPRKLESRRMPWAFTAGAASGAGRSGFELRQVWEASKKSSKNELSTFRGRSDPIECQAPCDSAPEPGQPGLAVADRSLTAKQGVKRAKQPTYH